MDDSIWQETEPDGVLLERVAGTRDPTQAKVDAVFEGGGVKAIAQVGGIRAAERVGLGWNRLGGTSGGAIVASLLAAGLGARRIWEVLTETDLTRMMDVFYLPNVRLLRRFRYFYLPLLPNVLLFKAAFEGREFEELMRRHLLVEPGGSGARDMTFGDLRVPKEHWWQSEHRLKLVATDVSRRRPVVFPDDAAQYREYDNGDEMPVYRAVRMSMSIPLVFKPVTLHEKRTGKPCLIVDGGVSSNFPIWLFDRPASAGPPQRPTFGFLLDEGAKIHSTRTVLGLVWSTFHTGMGAMDRRLSPWDADRTIRMPTGGVSTTDFDLPATGQKRLLEWGYGATMAFLRRFDWRAHVKNYRVAREAAGGADV